MALPAILSSPPVQQIGSMVLSKVLGSVFNKKSKKGASQETSREQKLPEWIERELPTIYHMLKQNAPKAFAPYENPRVAPLSNLQESGLQRLLAASDELQPELTKQNSKVKELTGRKTDRVSTRENPQKITTRSNPQKIDVKRFTEAMKNGEFDKYTEAVLKPQLEAYDRKAASDAEEVRILSQIGGKRYSSTAANQMQRQQEANQTGRNELMGILTEKLGNIFASDEDRMNAAQMAQAGIYKSDIYNELAAQEAQAGLNSQDIARELQAALANQTMSHNDITRDQSIMQDIMANLYNQANYTRQGTNDLLTGGELQQAQQQALINADKELFAERQGYETNQLNSLFDFLKNYPATSSSSYGVAPNKHLADIETGMSIFDKLNQSSGGKVGELLGNKSTTTNTYNDNLQYGAPSYYKPVKFEPLPETPQGGGKRYFTPAKY